MTDELPQIILYTDGACRGNPGPGGWACILRDLGSGQTKELCAGSSRTTNNRMEMRAALAGLSALKKPCHVKLVSDSQYVIKGLTEWVAGWKRRGWRTATKAPVKNVDLWQQLDAEAARHRISCEWVKGHAGHAFNEKCDELACKAADWAVRNGEVEDLDLNG